MTISRTPLRISFFGGGTDFPEYFNSFPGACLSTTINKYIYVMVNKKFDSKIRVNYSITECVDSVEDLKHELVRESLKKFKITNGIEISSISDIPSEGSGLGSSSAYTVGLLNSLSSYNKKYCGPKLLAYDACGIEINRCSKPIGVQDQYACAIGGFNLYQFCPDIPVKIDPIEVNCLNILNNRLLLFYTGMTRSSTPILQEQSSNISSNLKVLKSMRDMAHAGFNFLNKGYFDNFGQLLDQAWELKKKLATSITTPQIDQWYDIAKAKGALGGKILGAGGGGFLLLYADEAYHRKIMEALPLERIYFNFENEGTQIIYDRN